MGKLPKAVVLSALLAATLAVLWVGVFLPLRGNATKAPAKRAQMVPAWRAEALGRGQAYHSVLNAVLDEHEFPAKGKQMVLRGFESTDLGEWGLALIVLSTAVQKGLYPRADFEDLVAKIAAETDPVQTSICLHGVAHTYMIGTASRSLIDEQDAVREASDSQHVSAADRRFVLKAMADKGPRNQAEAGYLLAGKQGLDPQTRAWVDGQVKLELARSHGEFKSYWLFVQRVVRARNGP